MSYTEDNVDAIFTGVNRFTGSTVGDGDTIAATAEGFTFKARIMKDDDSDVPWQKSDGHGNVRMIRTGDWTIVKQPGERLLWRDEHCAYVYDVAEARHRAWLDGWGCEGGPRDGESQTAYADRAVEEDFEYLKGWCNDDWYYVGVCVSVWKEDIELTGSFAHAIWGVENTAVDYLNDLANNLAYDALKDAEAKLIALCAGVILPDPRVIIANQGYTEDNQ